MKHTPGPWSVSGFDPLYINDVASGEHIGKALVIKGLNAKDRTEIMMANATLMAASPQMYSSLVTIRICLNAELMAAKTRDDKLAISTLEININLIDMTLAQAGGES